jgi:hypothetical protein
MPEPSTDIPPEIRTVYESLYGPGMASVKWTPVSLEDAIKEVHGEEALQAWKIDPVKHQSFKTDVFLDLQSKKDPKVREWLDKMGRQTALTLPDWSGRKATRASKLVDIPTDVEREALVSMGLKSTDTPTPYELLRARNIILGKEKKEKESQEKAWRDKRYMAEREKELEERKEENFSKALDFYRKEDRARIMSARPDIATTMEWATRYAKSPERYEYDPRRAKAKRSLLEKFQENPTDLSNKELRSLSQQIARAYALNEISKKDYDAADNLISDLLLPEKNINMIAIKQRMEKEAYTKDPNQARVRLRDTIASAEFRRLIGEGKDEDEAAAQAAYLANKKVNAINFSETLEYETRPDVGLGKLRNAQVGIYFDEDTNSYKVADDWTLFKQVFKKQMIASPYQKEIEKAALHAFKDVGQLDAIGMSSLSAQVKDLDRAKVAEYFEKGINPSSEDFGIWQRIDLLAPSRDKAYDHAGINRSLIGARRLKKDLKEHDPEKYALKLEIDKKYSKIGSLPQHEFDTALRGVTTLGRAIAPLLQQETELGATVETAFGASMRGVLAGPGAFWTAMLSETLPEILQREHAAYKRHQVIALDDQGVPTIVRGPKGKVVRQALINWALFQGGPEYVPTFAPIYDVLGEGGSWALGVGLSLFEPVTGVTIPFTIGRTGLKTIGTLTKGTGKGLASPKLMWAGQQIKNMAHPLQWRKTSQTVKIVDDMLEGRYKGQASLVRKELDGSWSEGELWDIFKKEANHNRLLDRMTDEMSELVATSTIISRMVDAGFPEKELLKNLPNTPTVTRYIQEAREMLALPGGKDMTLEGLVTALAREDLEALTRGAQKNPLARRALNKAEYAAKVAIGRGGLSKTTTPLNKELQDELFKINIARGMEGRIAPEEIEKALKGYDELPQKLRTTENLHKIFFGKETSPADLQSMIIATGRSLRNDLKTGMLNYFPTDMIHMGGDVLVPAENLTKSGFKSFRKQWNTYLGDIGDMGYVKQTKVGDKIIEPIWIVPYAKKNLLQNLVIEEVGIGVVRFSDFYMDLLRDIGKGTLDNKGFWKLRELVTEKLAIDNFKGVRMADAGDQWTRAITPKPLRETLVRTGRKGELGYQPSGVLLKKKDVGRILSNMFRTGGKSVTVRKVPEKTPYTPTPFGKEPALQDLGAETLSDIAERTGISEQKLRDLNGLEKGERLRPGDVLVTKPSKQWQSIFKGGNANNPPALARVITDMQNALAKLDDMFLEELNTARKTVGPLKAADKVFDDTWSSEVGKFQARKDAYVERYMGGSYKEYLYKVLQNRGSDATEQLRSKELLGKIERELKRAYKAEDIPDEAYRAVVLDYEMYMDKMDAWNQILKSFYGNSKKITSILEDSRQIHDAIKKGTVYGALPTAVEKKVFAPKSSRIRDPNLTNLNEVTKILEGRFPEELKGMGMQTLGGAKAAAGSLFPWAMRSRMSEVFDKQMRVYLDQNPQYAMDMVPDPLASGGMVLDLPKLIEKYKVIAAEMLEEVPTGMHKTKKGRYLSGRLTQEAGDKFIDEFGESMARAHFESLNRISPKKRKEIIEWISGVTMRQGTLRPDMKSIKKEVALRSEDALKNLRFEYDKWAKEAKRLGRSDLSKGFREKQIKEINDAFLGIGKHDDGYSGSMIDTAYGSIIDQYRQFWQASGATVNDNVFRTIVENRPHILSLKSDDPRVLMYGKDHADTIEKFKAMITGEHLKSFTDKLMAKAEGRGVRAFIDSVIDSTRTNMTSGMLGGSFPVPGFRYNGINVLTWPFIAATTTGTTGLKGVLKAPMERGFKNIVHKISGAPDNAVMFTDKLGRKYTAGELKYLYQEYHTGFSKQDVVYFSKQADSMMNELGLFIDGQKKSNVRRMASKFVDPRNKNLFARFAMGADDWMRKNVFYQALKEGHDPAAAAEIARRSLYDYGTVDKHQRKALHRYMMFVSFRMMNLQETANVIFRTAKKDVFPGPLYGAIKLNAAMQKDADMWLYGDDDTKMRWFTGFRDEMVAGKRVASMGPMIPAVEAFEAKVNFIESVADGLSMKTAERSVDLMLDGQWRPAIDYVLDHLKVGSAKGGYSARGGKVPDEYIWWMRGTDTFNYFRAPSQEGVAGWMFHFNIVPTDFGYRRLEGPTFEDFGSATSKEAMGGAVQYRFKTKGDQMKFATWVLATIALGQKRAMTDVANAAMAAEKERLPLMPGPGKGVPSLTPGRKFGYKSVPSMLGYLTAAETPKVIHDKARRDIRKWDAMIRKLERMAESYGEEQ